MQFIGFTGSTKSKEPVLSCGEEGMMAAALQSSSSKEISSSRGPHPSLNEHAATDNMTQPSNKAAMEIARSEGQSEMVLITQLHLELPTANFTASPESLNCLQAHLALATASWCLGAGTLLSEKMLRLQKDLLG